jgi:hypothetical protein
MFAGNDVSWAENVITVARQSLAMVPHPTSLDVSQKLREAYQTNRTTKIKDLFLSSYGWDLNCFMQYGRALLGQTQFDNLLYQVNQFDLGFSLLVGGFLDVDASQPMFFQIDNPGAVTPVMLTGYVAIGTGKTSALSYLDWKHQTWHLSLQESLYNGIAAKSLAESDLAVGPGTSVLIVERSGDHRFLVPDEIQQIKDIWLNEEASIRPPNLEQRVAAILAQSE